MVKTIAEVCVEEIILMSFEVLVHFHVNAMIFTLSSLSHYPRYNGYECDSLMRHSRFQVQIIGGTVALKRAIIKKNYLMRMTIDGSTDRHFCDNENNNDGDNDVDKS